MLSGVERWWGQLVVAAHLIIVYHSVVAHLPDKIIGGAQTEPRLKHVADAEPLVLPRQQAPCVLQPAPELHKARLIVFYSQNQKLLMTIMTMTMVTTFSRKNTANYS